MLTGVVGSIKWGYYTAAAINGYTVTRSKDGRAWSLVATVVLSDAFKMAQRPLLFSAATKRGVYTWPIRSFALNPDTHRLTADLGPVEFIKAA